MKISFQEHHLLQILKRYVNQSLPLDLFLSLYFRSNKALGANDRRIIAEDIYGLMRWKALIDHLLFKKDLTWENRYAFYKQFRPEDYQLTSSIPVHLRASFPEPLFSLLVQQYGEKKAFEICLISNTQAPTTLRINPIKTTREFLLNLWKDTYPISACTHSAFGIVFHKRAPLFSFPEFKQGLFEVQDEGSQLLASLIKAKPGDHVLDYCAGSGGKTLAFAHNLQQKGVLYLHDIREHALEQAQKRLARAGIQNAQILPPNHSQLEKLKKKIDWVLVDAPCSGTGTVRRNPDMKEKFNLEMLSRLVGQQRHIFEKALSFLNPKGKIVYATCSLLQDENEKQIDHFLNTYSLEVVETFFSVPTKGGMDGFFAATMQRKPLSS